MTTAAITAASIAGELSGTLLGADRPILGIAPLGEASSGELTFAVDPSRQPEQISAVLTAGGVLLAPLSYKASDALHTVVLVRNPRAAFAAVLSRHFALKIKPGIAETARVHPRAVIDPTASIGEYTVVREGASIGPGSEVRDHVVIGRNVKIGAGALIKSHAVIGEEGFGIEKDDHGNNLRIPHLGSVVLGDHVEVGSFTTVCSGTIRPTRVDNYAKIDDHVHVSHNVHVGSNVIITACAEVSGSVVLESGVWLGPNSSILQGLTIGRDALLGIGAVAVKSIPENEVRVGNPARRLGDNKQG